MAGRTLTYKVLLVEGVMLSAFWPPPHIAAGTSDLTELSIAASFASACASVVFLAEHCIASQVPVP